MVKLWFDVVPPKCANSSKSCSDMAIKTYDNVKPTKSLNKQRSTFSITDASTATIPSIIYGHKQDEEHKPKQRNMSTEKISRKRRNVDYDLTDATAGNEEGHKHEDKQQQHRRRIKYAYGNNNNGSDRSNTNKVVNGDDGIGADKLPNPSVHIDEHLPNIRPLSIEVSKICTGAQTHIFSFVNM